MSVSSQIDSVVSSPPRTSMPLIVGAFGLPSIVVGAELVLSILFSRTMAP